MSFSNKLLQLYFDFAYNPVYDFTTATTPSYRRLQQECIDKFDFKPDDRILCIGIGTGNEIIPILERNGQVEIVGVDTSPRALVKATRRAAKRGREIEVYRMDAGKLEFDDGSFDKVFCFHVMDFVPDSRVVAAEAIRVLKRGGQFVVTYPSAAEGIRLAVNVFRESLSQTTNKYKALLQYFITLVVGNIVYWPLLFRGNRGGYSNPELDVIFTGLDVGDFYVEVDSVYQDAIVYGRK